MHLMLLLVVPAVLFFVLVVYAGALSLARPGKMSNQWLAEHRASRAV